MVVKMLDKPPFDIKPPLHSSVRNEPAVMERGIEGVR
jgi:hypothetical protein